MQINHQKTEKLLRKDNTGAKPLLLT